MHLKNFAHIQRDLAEGFRVLIQSSEELMESVSTESKNMNLRFHEGRLDTQIEVCFRDLGKLIHGLYVFQGKSDFSKEFKIHELIDQANELINERKKLIAENSTDQETESLGDKEDEGKIHQ